MIHLITRGDKHYIRLEGREYEYSDIHEALGMLFKLRPFIKLWNKH